MYQNMISTIKAALVIRWFVICGFNYPRVLELSNELLSTGIQLSYIGISVVVVLFDGKKTYYEPKIGKFWYSRGFF
jgi:hypothetical protein